MVTRLSLLCLLFCITPATLIADEAKDESPFDWSFVDLEYLDLDIDTDFSGFNGESNNSYELEGQYALGKHLLLYGARRCRHVHQICHRDR